MIPLLTRLEQELSTCADPLRAAELQAERACYLARVGRFAEANEITVTLRQNYGDGRNARISVWIMLTEGLILYFEKHSPIAGDRLRRAEVLSAAFQMQRLHGLSSAWMAHIDFDKSHHESMLTHLSYALAAENKNLSDVQLRVGLVLGDANLYIGRKSRAQYWYEYARHHALVQGDRAAIGAIIYNRCVFGLANLQIMCCLSDDFNVEDQLQSLEAELQSALNYDNFVKIDALAHLNEIARMHICMLRGQWLDATKILRALRTPTMIAEDQGFELISRVDLMWCEVKNENFQQAAHLLHAFDVSGLSKVDASDRLILFSKLDKIYDALGYKQKALDCAATLLATRAECEQEMRTIGLILDEVESVSDCD